MIAFRALLLAASLVLGACSLSRPSVEPAAYYLSVTRPTPEASAPKPVTVRVRPFRAAPMYERKEFLYRLDGERVVADFYNEFADNPESMITGALIEWLKSSQLFKAVIAPRVPVDTPYALDGTIVELYGDFREPGKPAAVLAIQFYLVGTGADDRDIVFDRRLEERVPISAQTAQALVQGYNEALRRILATLERDLAALDLNRSTVTQR